MPYILTEAGIDYCKGVVLDFYRRDPEGARALAAAVGLDLEEFLKEHDPERRREAQHEEGPYR